MKSRFRYLGLSMLAIPLLVLATEFIDISSPLAGRWTCYVDGVPVEGQHDREYKASARAANLKLDNPNSEIICQQTRTLVAALTAAGRTLLEDAGAAVISVEPIPPAENQLTVWNSTPTPVFTTAQSGTYSLANAADTTDTNEDASDTDGDALTFANETGCTLPTGITIDNTNDEIDYDGLGTAGDTTGCVFSANDGTDAVNSSAFTISIADAGAFYFDQDGGSDSNDGLSAGTAWQSITKANSVEFGPGSQLLFQCGDTFGDDLALEITDSGASGNPITISSYDCATAPDPVIRQSQANGDWITYDGIDFNGDQFPTRVVRIRGDNVTIQNSEVHNGTGDGIDIRGGACATSCTIQNTEIHHLLAGTFGSSDDAHGIGIRAGADNTVNVTLSNVNIHEVSGDSIQADPNWQSTNGWTINLTFENSQCWTQPLAANFNAGWSAGDSPGENCIDTKADTNETLNLTVENVTSYGFTDIAEISNRSPFNLKLTLTATLDRITVYDSEHCFRLRGDTGSGNPTITIMNAVVYDCVRGMRVEDALDDLKVYNSTFGSGITTFYQEVTGGIDAGADLRNNMFLGTVPGNDFTDVTNVTFAADDIDNEPDNNYEPCSDATAIVDQGATIAAVTQDFAGTPRAAPYNIGAYETSANCGSGAPPDPDTYYDLLVARGDLHTAVAFRSQADVSAYTGANNEDIDYDSVQDAMRFRWPTAGGGSNINQAQVDISPILGSGKVFVTWEEKWSSNWASPGGRSSIHGIKTFKNQQWSDGPAFTSGGLQLEIRKLHRRYNISDQDIPADKAGTVDIRDYSGPGGGPGGTNEMAGILADYTLEVDEWTRYFLFVEFDAGELVSLWVTHSGTAPVAVYLQQDTVISGSFESFWFEQNSSQTYSGPTSYKWARNLVVLDSVADIAAAQVLVTQGSLE